MKQLLFICTFLLLCINSLAKEVVIELYRNYYPEDKAKDNRSITLEPTATIDGNTISIYSDVTISGFQMSIKDNLGNIVYSYNDMTSSRCYTLEVYDLPEGKYVLEFNIGKDSFYGNFIIS